MQLVSRKTLSDETVRKFFVTHWGSSEMVISSGVYRCDELDGFAMQDTQGDLLGLVTFITYDKTLEIISLNSVREGEGVGGRLMKAVEEFAQSMSFSRISLITTNDNLHALRFYQKRGYVLCGIHLDAVAMARKYKPTIPLVSEDGIPIRDELELEKVLGEGV
ncbi:GNAT family N-acetyltransferase [Paenalkalicoccus suaedae]|uniref:GNAT family N-acetyltransferase n=1 Tax=Paenalkalicoccus suaedae TaxID=2592382 RepID=A0A859F9T8_9BACI|nr:GNAT family N-acetyltransferase [Paenalkalicoccus suaedae]QKS69899.1 GNAT family N-acetyltransferase [Paenalkalicoccus suaedae]